MSQHGENEGYRIDSLQPYSRKKKDGTFVSLKTVKRVHGFQTGDMVKAAVPRGIYQGTHIGRLASVGASGDLVLRLNLKWCKAGASTAG